MTMYQLTTSGTTVIRLSDGASIPLPPAESEGFAYQAWLDAGNTPLPVPTPTLAQAQAAQIAAMYSAYQGAIAQDVSFTTAAGVSKLFQADPQSINNAQAMLAAYTASGVPAGFYWISRDNAQVAFTLADLQGLAKAMGDQGWASFQRLQARKASILAAASVADVQAVLW